MDVPAWKGEVTGLGFSPFSYPFSGTVHNLPDLITHTLTIYLFRISSSLEVRAFLVYLKTFSYFG